MPLHTAHNGRKPVAVSFNVDIAEAGEGRFRARCREVPVEITSANVEHDCAFLLTKAGHRDGGIQFWRGETRSLFHSSFHAMGRFRISLGEDCPAKVRRREFSFERPEGASPEPHDNGGAASRARDTAPAVHALCEARS